MGTSSNGGKPSSNAADAATCAANGRSTLTTTIYTSPSGLPLSCAAAASALPGLMTTSIKTLPGVNANPPPSATVASVPAPVDGQCAVPVTMSYNGKPEVAVNIDSLSGQKIVTEEAGQPVYKGGVCE